MPDPVDAKIYEAVAKAVSPEFAFSYLVKAKQINSVIIPHTVTGWERLVQSFPAMKAFRENGYTLRKPDLWHPGRDSPAPSPYSLAA